MAEPSQETEIFDITLELHPGVLVYPGDAPPQIRRVSSLEAGDALNASALELGCHVGTHVDAPAHFVRGGRCLSDYPVAAFMGPALVLDLRGLRWIGAEHLTPLGIARDHHLLIRSDNSERLAHGSYDRDHVYLTRDAAEYLISLAPRSLGFDYYSVDSSRVATLVAHEIFARHELLVYVCLDLGAVPEGAYLFHGLPLKLAAVEAAPVRAILSSAPR